MNFKLYLEKSGAISFDFDGVLHTSLVPGTGHPIDYDEWWSWEPYEKMQDLLKKEAVNHRIIVVTRRNPEHEPAIQKFLDYYNLPVDRIFTTSNGPKTPTLIREHAIRHYDDDLGMERELKNTNVEFVPVPRI